jgi:hypothetical protein
VLDYRRATPATHDETGGIGQPPAGTMGVGGMDVPVGEPADPVGGAG